METALQHTPRDLSDVCSAKRAARLDILDAIAAE
jgi:hypothetical protein